MQLQPMTTKQVLTLLRQGESESVEFKKVFDREAIETLSAFANTHGGRIFNDRIEFFIPGGLPGAADPDRIIA